MSISGSLMGYENNNEVVSLQLGNGSSGGKACKKPVIKALPVVTSVNAQGVTSTGPGGISNLTGNGKHHLPNGRFSSSSRRGRRRESCARGHLNSLWSVWYGIIAVGFQAYIAFRCTRRFIAYLSLPWPADAPPPKIELHACLALAGTGVLLLPILLAAACLKLGNLANDGIKLGRQLSTCSRDPPTSSLLNAANPDTGVANNLWRHGGPTAAFVHLCTAMCFLLPSLLMEARLIHAGFLPKDAVWRTDLDWIVDHRNPFANIPENVSLSLSSGQTPGGGYYTSAQPYSEIDLDEILNSTSSFEEITSSALPQPTKLSTLLRLTPSTSAYSTEAATSDGTASTVSTSKKPTSKMNARNVQQRLRPKMKKNSAIARQQQRHQQQQSGQGPTAAGLTSAGNMSAYSLPLTFDSLADLDRPESLNLEIDETSEVYGPITLEYLNYAIALGVYSVRYPAVFWATNKALGTIFSIQLVANAAQSLLAYAGMSILYKIQVVGPMKVLPLLRHRTVPTTTSTLSGIGALSSFFGSDRFFLLNPHVTLGIFALSSLLVLCSSMVMYLYAYGRFAGFLNQERERRVIMSKEGRRRSEDMGWTYMTQPAALCLFLAIGICSAPLLYDYTVVYRGSLDGVVFVCIVGSIMHLGLWLVIWLFLSLKRRWTFKLRVTIGRATVRSARSVKLVTDVDLVNRKDEEDGSGAPLLVVGNGRTYTVAETSPKKAIMSVIQKAAMERKARSQAGNLDSMDPESAADGDEQIYWLRPKLRPSPVQAGDGSSGGNGQSNEKGWLNKKLKQKVTFNDLPSTSGSRHKGKARRGDGVPEDDGDYATLRELPLVTAHDLGDDTTSEENKLLECVNDDQVTYYASGNRDLQPSEGEPSPMLSPSALPGPPTLDVGLPLPLPPPTPTNAAVQESVALGHVAAVMPQQPRCLRRADSGMPHEELTPRSDSSHSPPLNGHCSASNNSTSSNSETSSSGVHSNASNASNASSHRRANSVEDLTNEPREEPNWRSCSLQRGTQPPSQMMAQTAAVQPQQQVPRTTLYNGELAAAAVILENPNEATVVIRRKNSRPKLQEPPALSEEPFGRSTNMRMTSFTENNELRSIQASSATLPHYPTQPVVTYPHCSTMPLPHASSHAASNSLAGSSGSCGSVQPRHPGGPLSDRSYPSSSSSSLETYVLYERAGNQVVLPGQQQQPSVPSHTTLPSHHNGVRLMLHAGPNPFVKRFPPATAVQPWGAVLPSASGAAAIGHHHHLHHTFPQAPAPSMNGKLAAPTAHQPRHSDRDSANFSMASSGDSDTCLPH
ncbi:protein tincar isoform X3 [Nasonia vitripennis]|uniref:Protein tincar n=1 Tax=Nasonia vitripennis TaxID=7425 RepID=A0A7M7H259_NASVI|nr:protein tincar isoform X3 [Nasonia vitripennis]